MTYQPKIDRIEDDGSRTAHTLVETAKIDALFAALALERPKDFDPLEALKLEIGRLREVERRWSEACEIARTHCPVEVGESHIRQGIPRLAEKLAALKAGQRQTDLMRGLPLPQHIEDMLARLWTWTTTYGEALRPGLRADTFGEGMREAKEQVSRLLVPCACRASKCQNRARGQAGHVGRARRFYVGSGGIEYADGVRDGGQAGHAEERERVVRYLESLSTKAPRNMSATLRSVADAISRGEHWVTPMGSEPF